MSKKAIILTSNKNFGELIRQVLSDASELEPQQLSAPAQALEAANGELDLLVLDTDFADLDLPAFVAQVRAAAPQAHLLVIPAESAADDLNAAELGVDAVLPKPFYLPDLVAEVEKLYGPLVSMELPKTARYGDAPPELKPAEPLAPAHAAPAWLADNNLAAQHLAQLSLESASQAALVTRRGEVWAYAGQLPQAAAEELAAALNQDAAEDEGDLARFVHLNATQADYMLYATALGADYKLALVFDAQMPFSKMRAQVDKLANAMASAPAELDAVPAKVEAQANAVTERQAKPAAVREAAPSRPAPARLAPGAGVLKHGLQPVLASAAADLHYAYVLVPRLPAHTLEGDLADKLAAWLPQLCVAFAWRLEHLSIQPGFVQWLVSLPSDAAPESVVQTLDKYLSERIFEEFPGLKRDNPSGQFFAPGCLITNGGLPDAASVAAYIRETRNRQGIPS